MVKLENRLPASLGDMDNPYKNDLFLRDPAIPNLPVRITPMNPLGVLPPSMSALKQP
jgi:hypothetical protein